MFKRYNRTIIICFVLIFVCLSSLSFANPKPKPTIALVLGGGAARGYSHIGLIKAFEENGIPIDMLVGTSMGSIVASLYAAGYSVDNLTEIVLNLDVGSLMNVALPPQGGLISTSKLASYLDHLLQQKTFAELKLPFYAVITDLVTGEGVALNQGNVARGVQASMSIPALFPPIQINGSYYVDGGMKNAVPANVAFNQGADLIFGVDVKKDLETINHNSILNNLQRALWFMIDGYVEQNTTVADVIIVPEVKYDSYMDYQKADLFIAEGYEAGIKYMDQIKASITALDPDFEFVPYAQIGFSQTELTAIMEKAKQESNKIVPPFSIMPELKSTNQGSLKPGIRFQNGSLGWFNFGYRYDLSPSKGGHELFLGWNQPSRVRWEIFANPTHSQPKVGTEIELQLSSSTKLKACYLFNGAYRWRIALENSPLYATKRFQLDTSLGLTDYGSDQTILITANHTTEAKLFLSEEHFNLLEIALAKPYLYGQIDFVSPIQQFDPKVSYQAGVGVSLEMFGLYPVNLQMVYRLD